MGQDAALLAAGAGVADAVVEEPLDELPESLEVVVVDVLEVLLDDDVDELLDPPRLSVL